MDLKKISTYVFNGDQAAFPAWSRQVRSVLALSGLDKPLAPRADLRALSDENIKLYHQLCISLQGPALVHVGRVAEGDGVSLWNRLHEVYASKSAAHIEAIHAQLLSVTLASSGSVAALVQALETKLDQLRLTGTDMTMSETMARAHLCRQLPQAYQPIVYRATSEAFKWDKLCEEC